MSTMQNFRNYFVWIVGFFIISVILENALLADMYDAIGGSTDGSLVLSGQSGTNLEISVSDARATNVNGYIMLSITNTTSSYIESCCAKVDLYTENSTLAATKYIDVSDLDANETRTYKINFKAQEVESYVVSLVEDAPDKTNILNLFGWEIDLTNVFGRDLTSIIDVNSLKNTGLNIWSLTLAFLKSVPAWAYLVAAGIVIWYLPSGYFFGIF